MTTVLHRTAEPEIEDVRAARAAGRFGAAARPRVQLDGQPVRTTEWGTTEPGRVPAR